METFGIIKWQFPHSSTLLPYDTSTQSLNKYIFVTVMSLSSMDRINTVTEDASCPSRSAQLHRLLEQAALKERLVNKVTNALFQL